MSIGSGHARRALAGSTAIVGARFPGVSISVTSTVESPGSPDRSAHESAATVWEWLTPDASCFTENVYGAPLAMPGPATLHSLSVPVVADLLFVAVTRGTAPLALTQMRPAAGVGQARSWSAGTTDMTAVWPAGTASVISTTASTGRFWIVAHDPAATVTVCGAPLGSTRTEKE